MATQPLSAHSSPIKSDGPAGHEGPRATILLYLKQHGEATIQDLAAALGCSNNTMRHHLRALEHQQVLVHQRIPHGVGAPANTYHLTRQGHALFPHRYEQTVGDLLDHVVALQGRDAAIAVLEAQYDALARHVEAAAAGVPEHRRGEVVARVLADEGFMATWTVTTDGGTLTEHNCPHRVVAERFPEVCAAEEAFLTRALGVVVERRSHIAAGCGTCSYHVAHPAGGEKA